MNHSLTLTTGLTECLESEQMQRLALERRRAAEAQEVYDATAALMSGSKVRQVNFCNFLFNFVSFVLFVCVSVLKKGTNP